MVMVWGMSDSNFLWEMQVELWTGVATIRAWRGKKSVNHTRIDCSLSFKKYDGRPSEPIFERGDTWCFLPNRYDPASKWGKELVMALFAMKPGDTDSEFFKTYTRKQLNWAIEYGAQLDLERQALFCDENGEIK
jgi:hypothetical protein